MLTNLLHTSTDTEISELLTLVSQANQAAFASLVKAFWNKVYSQALAYTKSPVQAQEIVQDVFLKVWEYRDRLHTIENFSNFLFILSRNQIISGMRKNLKTKTSNDWSILEEELLVPDKQFQYKETYSLILKGIEGLPPTRRKVFKMSRLEGMSHEEIATAMALSKSTVKGHIVLALNFLRNYVYIEDRYILLIVWILFC